MTPHAVLLEGDYTWACAELPEVCQREGADVLHIHGTRMGIDEVRKLITAAYQTPLTLSHRHFVLAFDELTVEAQNALLKLLEEPPVTARFYMVVPDREKLLPTLLSRLISEGKKNRDTVTPGDLTEFLSAPYQERLQIIGDRMTKKDDIWAEAILREIERYAAAQADASLIRAVLELRRTFSLPGASRKMILEHLALMLPPKV